MKSTSLADLAVVLVKICRNQRTLRISMKVTSQVFAASKFASVDGPLDSADLQTSLGHALQVVAELAGLA